MLYGPSKPEIEGYAAGAVLNSGDKLTLACISRGGNPLPSLSWYNEDELVDSSSTSSTDGSLKETTNVYSFAVRPEDNKKQFRCEASNPIGSLSSEIRLNVHFPPVNIKINGPSVGRINDILRYVITHAAAVCSRVLRAICESARPPVASALRVAPHLLNDSSLSTIPSNFPPNSLSPSSLDTNA